MLKINLFNMVNITMIAAFMPFAGYAATTINTVRTPSDYSSQVNIGAGYSVPVSNRGETIIASVGVNSNFGLDCSGLNWSAQLTQQMKLDIGLSDLKSIGSALIAASPGYLTAALSPTKYEAFQNALKNAKAKIGVLKNDCRTMEAALLKNDPLGLVKLRKQGEAAMGATAAGQAFDKGIETASNLGVHLSLSETINDSGLDQKAKNTLNAILGDLTLDAGKGKKSSDATLMDNDRMEKAFENAREQINNEITDRLIYGKNCDKPLFAEVEVGGEVIQLNDPYAFSPGSEALVATANQNNIELEGVQNAETGKLDLTPKEGAKLVNLEISKSIREHVTGRFYPEASCGAYQHMNKIGMGAGDRRALAQLLADNITIRGMAATIEDMNAQLQALRETTDKPEVLDLAQGRMDILESRYQKLKDKILLSSSMAQSQLLAEKRADARRARASRERHRDVQTAQHGTNRMPLPGIDR